MITFFDEPFSHWCVKVRRILEYKKLAFETRRVGYHDKRELLAATGQDYVPALVHDGRIVTWPEIPDYLEQLAPDPTIHPDGTRAVARVIERWAHARLEELTWRIAAPDMPATFEDDAERWVFVEMQTLKRGPLEVLRTRQPEFLADLRGDLGLLEDLLEGRDFLLGDRPGLADFAVFGALAPLPYAGHALPDGFPRLGAWHARIAAV